MPNTPGGSDLANFLRVSEQTRANKAAETDRDEQMQWNMGAPDRAIAEEERKRQQAITQNQELGRLLETEQKNFLQAEKDKFRFDDGVKAQIREKYPNASEDQLDQLYTQARSEVGQSPHLYTNPQDMNASLTQTLLNSGYNPANVDKDMLNTYISPNFPGAPAPMAKDLREELLGQPGLLDAVEKMGLSVGADGRLSSKSGSGEDPFSFDNTMKGMEFVDDFMNNPNNQFKRGDKDWWNVNMPFTKQEVYKDQVEKVMGVLEQQDKISPVYTAAALRALTTDGQWPKGVSPDDLTNPESQFFKTVQSGAARLQAGHQNFGGGGVSVNGSSQGFSFQNLRDLVNADREASLSMVQQLDGMDRRGNGRLTPQEQLAFLTEEQRLRDLGILLEGPLMGGTPSPNPPQGSNQNPASDPVVPVPDNSDPVVAPGEGAGNNVLGSGSQDERMLTEVTDAVSNTETEDDLATVLETARQKAAEDPEARKSMSYDARQRRNELLTKDSFSGLTEAEAEELDKVNSLIDILKAQLNEENSPEANVDGKVLGARGYRTPR